ncbi:Zinc finger protein CONSTANS-like [Salvia divinorum]|uniref:Zinc finger protein CONSTANS-like n=1 Tax=Salvia divinorum TaxID=28513 RepID=A0ABD1I6G7_SALDI
MLKSETASAMKDGGDATNTWARTCDACRSATSALYCRADRAYLCASCDARIHEAASLHDRVWVCEACERAPAAFVCKADSASLCPACDAEIHSANPLACRHHRVPVQPIPYSPSAEELLAAEGDNEDEAGSWLLLNPIRNGDARPPSFLDEYLDLDLDDYNEFSEGYSYNNEQKQQHCSVAGSSYDDSIVPIDYHKGYEAGYSYSASMTHTVSTDIGVVPESTSEASSMKCEASVSHCHKRGTIDLFTSPLIEAPTQLSQMDREARVLRYKEKKKTRKFEKTIRYASRKAYAETRPRIKGRFAKRKAAAQSQVEQIFSSQSDNAYGVVPSF